MPSPRVEFFSSLDVSCLKQHKSLELVKPGKSYCSGMEVFRVKEAGCLSDKPLLVVDEKLLLIFK